MANNFLFSDIFSFTKISLERNSLNFSEKKVLWSVSIFSLKTARIMYLSLLIILSQRSINVLPGKVRPLRQKCPRPRALLCLLSLQSTQSAGTKTLQFSPNNVKFWLIFCRQESESGNSKLVTENDYLVIFDDRLPHCNQSIILFHSNIREAVTNYLEFLSDPGPIIVYSCQ